MYVQASDRALAVRLGKMSLQSRPMSILALNNLNIVTKAETYYNSCWETLIAVKEYGRRMFKKALKNVQGIAFR